MSRPPSQPFYGQHNQPNGHNYGAQQQQYYDNNMNHYPQHAQTPQQGAYGGSMAGTRPYVTQQTPQTQAYLTNGYQMQHPPGQTQYASHWQPQVQYQQPMPYQQPTQVWHPTAHGYHQHQHQHGQQPPHVMPSTQMLPSNDIQMNYQVPQQSYVPSSTMPVAMHRQEQAYHAQPPPRPSSISNLDGAGPARSQPTVKIEQSPRMTQPDRLVNQSPNIQSDQAQPMKRRKSNNGDVIPVQMTHNPMLKVDAPVPPPKAAPSGPPLEDVLSALADEYVFAARNLGDDSYEEYNRLLSAATVALRSALNLKFPDQRKEARIRIRLANLLYEADSAEYADQPGSDDEADEANPVKLADQVLSKGIVACEKLHDLRYTMHHTYIRHMSNPRAAAKAIDRCLQEVSNLGLRHWQHAFLLLRTTLCLQQGGSELRPALKYVHMLKQLSGGTSMKIFSACLEALACFAAGTHEDIEAAQRALAEARSYQLSEEMEAMPQVESLLNSLQMFSPVPEYLLENMVTQTRNLQAPQNQLSKEKQWAKDGCLSVPLDLPEPKHLIEDSFGIFTEGPAVSVKWLTSTEMMAVCYILSGIASLLKNGEKSEAERYLQQALKLVPVSKNKAMHNHVRYLLACALAARAKYVEAQDMIQHVDRPLEQSRFRLLNAMCEQAKGNLTTALQQYEPFVAQLRTQSDVLLSTDPLERDIQILAGLNSVHLMRQLHLAPNDIDSLLDALEIPCLEHTNRNFKAAYNIVVAAVDHERGSSIMEAKKVISLALDPAKSAKNQQMLAIIMSMMTETFYVNIIGEQAEKSANAAYGIAAKTGDPLWKAVGLGLSRSILERMGRQAESDERDQMAQKAVSQLPPSVVKALQLE